MIRELVIFSLIWLLFRYLNCVVVFRSLEFWLKCVVLVILFNYHLSYKGPVYSSCWCCQLFGYMTDRLPYSIRILLESAIRNCDNFQVTKADVEKIIDWESTSAKQVEIPFKPARVLLQVPCSILDAVYCDSWMGVIKWYTLFLEPFLISFPRILLESQLLLIWLACVMLWIGLAVILIRSILWYKSFYFLFVISLYWNSFYGNHQVNSKL